MHTLLADLDPEQRRVAEALRGPVRVLAGAGTGKTRAITHRIAHGVATGVYQPTEVLAVTFTTKAAGELRERLRTLGAPGVQARTFHSAALRQLRFFWPQVYGGDVPQIVDSKLGLVANAAGKQRLRTNQAMLRDLASEIEWSKVSNVRPEDYEARALARGREVDGATPEQVARIFGSYEEVKRGQGRMDLEDVLLLTAALLADDERVAAQVRQQYKFFVVDEFQDVSPLQATLLSLWLGGRDELCVVGDPAQTIYSFAGASPAPLLDFTTAFPHATTIELVRNYRSTPEVIEVANRVLAGSATKGVALQAQSGSGPAVGFQAHPDEIAEAEVAAESLLAHHRAGIPWREMAVLFRINAQSENFEEALSARKIPYVVRGAARFFDRAEVRQAIALLRGHARGGALSDDPVDDVRATLSGLGWSVEAPAGTGEARNRWESFDALATLALEFFTSGGGATLADLVDDLDRRASEQHAPVAEGVTLATLHTAKGLEWDVVHLCGLQDGTVPFQLATTPAEIEEERRLLYVGVTRARRHLAMSWSLARNPGQQARRKPSRFLDGVRPDQPLGRSGTAATRTGPRKAATCPVCGGPISKAEAARGACAKCPVHYDEALFDRLKEWRRERAQSDEVPPYVVFSNATLQAIAEVKPLDEKALLGVAGVGASKLESYAADVLELVRSSEISRNTH